MYWGDLELRTANSCIVYKSGPHLFPYKTADNILDSYGNFDVWFIMLFEIIINTDMNYGFFM
jgi:hypothetical protein